MLDKANKRRERSYTSFVYAAAVGIVVVLMLVGMLIWFRGWGGGAKVSRPGQTNRPILLQAGSNWGQRRPSKVRTYSVGAAGGPKFFNGQSLK